MDNEGVILFEILKVVRNLPSQDEKFMILAKALLHVSEEELAAAWASGEFKEVQARLVKRFEPVFTVR
jgi:hypothetical protein